MRRHTLSIRARRPALLFVFLVFAYPIISGQTPHVSENSGYVIPSPTISLMFWDNDWDNNNPVTRGRISTFVRSLVSNSYLAGASQYHINGMAFGGSYSTSVVDLPCGPRRPASTITTKQIFNWLTCELTVPHPTLPARAIYGGPFPSGTLVPGRVPFPPQPFSNDIYVVMLPTGTSISDSLVEIALPPPLTSAARSVFGHDVFPVFLETCGDYSGYHAFLIHPKGLVPFAVIPMECAKEAAPDVFLSNGTNAFESRGGMNGVWTTAGTYGAGWFAGDFNGDGRDDIVRYINQYGGAEVLLANRSGSGFDNAGTWSGGGTSGGGWFVGNFNGDKYDDLLRFTNQYGGAEVYLSTGSGFTSAGVWSGGGTNGAGWFVGDFDGDGQSDIARYTTRYGGAEVLRSTGSGFISAGVWTQAGTNGKGWFVGDFDHDGKSDLLRFTNQYGGAEVLRSTGTSFVSAGIWTQAGTNGARWFVGDFDGDGRDDVARYINQYGGAEVLRSTGSSFSSAGVWAQAGTDSNGWVVGDFNGDHKADLKRTVGSQWNGTASFNMLTATIAHEIVEAATDPIPALSWIDNSLSLTNNDRLTKGEVADICPEWAPAAPGTTVLGGYTVSQYWSNQEGGCIPDPGTFGAGWFVGDFNNDGRDDLLRYTGQFGGGRVFLSGGNGLRPGATWTTAGTNGGGWFVGDFDGDKFDDVIRFTTRYGGAEVLRSTGATFQSVGVWTQAGTNGKGWFVGDFNGDGKSDLVRFINQYGGAEVLRSTGTSFVSAGVWTQAGTNGKGWFVGDFDGDGKSDLVRFINQYGGAEVLRSTGAGFVSAGVWTQAGTNGAPWFVGDFDHDGKDDLLRYTGQYGGAEVLRSTGSTFVSAGIWTGAGTNGARWFVGDFNGDGASDVLRYTSRVGGAEVFVSTGSAFTPGVIWNTIAALLPERWKNGLADASIQSRLR